MFIKILPIALPIVLPIVLPIELPIVLPIVLPFTKSNLVIRFVFVIDLDI